MPLMRNPFRKAADEHHSDENARPGIDGLVGHGSVQRTDSSGSRSQPIGVRPPMEYKLSEINDSGVYLPPSPTEKASFWDSNRPSWSRNGSHRSVFNENEPFNISRESFDSYRRSFDISARSPIPDTSFPQPRHSFDTRRLRLPHNTMGSPPVPSVSQASFTSTVSSRRQPSPPATISSLSEEGEDTAEEELADTDPDKRVNPPESEPEDLENKFVDVGLDDEKVKPKKRSIFARFGDSSTLVSSDNRPGSSGLGTSSHGHGHGHGFFSMGRKRGASGQGAELGSIKNPGDGAPEIRVDG